MLPLSIVWGILDVSEVDIAGIFGAGYHYTERTIIDFISEIGDDVPDGNKLLYVEQIKWIFTRFRVYYARLK
jgi:hypothetical protein